MQRVDRQLVLPDVGPDCLIAPQRERIELRGFGVFVVKPRKRGVGRNPRTGEEVAIPSGKTIRFKPGKELQAHDNGETEADEAVDDDEF